MARLEWRKVGQRKGFIIELGRFGAFIGWRFLTIDIIGGYHREWY